MNFLNKIYGLAKTSSARKWRAKIYGGAAIANKKSLTGYRNRDKAFVLTIFGGAMLFILLMLGLSLHGLQNAFWGAIKSFLGV